MLLVILPANLQRKNMMATDYRHIGGPRIDLVGTQPILAAVAAASFAD
jgi:hypothetical protein